MNLPLQSRSSAWQRVADHLFFPVNMWLGEEASRKLRLPPIDPERIRAALPHCRGLLLDIACGNNRRVKSHGEGVGADIHPYAGIDVRCDAARLPFRSAVFDSVALLACLNHIVRRKDALLECRRVLRPGGVLLVSMIHPWVGRFSHPIRRRHDPDQLERGIGGGEMLGVTTREIEGVLADAGFRITLHRRFMWGLNSLYLAAPEPLP